MCQCGMMLRHRDEFTFLYYEFCLIDFDSEFYKEIKLCNNYNIFAIVCREIWSYCMREMRMELNSTPFVTYVWHKVVLECNDNEKQ
jgi:hypothetical protein